MHSVHALVLNSTHVSLSWSLLNDGIVPLFMVVQWSESSGLSGLKWARLPYSNHVVYIKGTIWLYLFSEVLLLFLSSAGLNR